MSDAQELIEAALAAATSDGCVVIAADHSETNLRWAANALTTNGQMRSRSLTVICTFERSAGTSVGAYCAIGAGVRIGRGCVIGSHVTIAHALIGNGAMIHSGVRIGFDGPISDVAGREIVGRFGRVIVQDGVEIGANAAIARGGLRDTVIGERSLIGPLAALPGGTRLERGSRILGGGFSAARKMV